MSTTQSRRSGEPGFTLLEILIAVTAFAIVLAAINAVFYSALRLRTKAHESFENAVPLQRALSIIKRDLENIVLPGGTLSGSLQTTPTANLSMNSSGGAAGTASTTPGQVGPNFFTASGIIDETSPFAEVQRVSYALLDSTNGGFGRDLFRSVSRNLLPSLEGEPLLQPLVGGVQALAFLYYDGSQWRDSWDTTVGDARTGLTNVLPQAIKVQLALASQGTRSELNPVELVVPLTLQARTNL
jgi:general secretion pathway protein J